MYGNMYSYPHRNDQKIHPSHFYPGIEPNPPQMYMNSTQPPVNYGWPWGINYGYAPPFACHGCCSHPYSTNPYPFGSPYSHPQPHCPVSYPSFPVQHIPHPPPCYPVEFPRYEFEKNVPMGGRHCCGCPNLMSHEKEQRNIRIEEEELPDGESRKIDSPIPLQIKNATCPVVWTPSDYGNNEHRSGNHGYSVVPKDSLENGCRPLDLKNFMAFEKQPGDDESKHKQDGDGKGHFPFPLFWMPYKSEEKEKEMYSHNSSESSPRLSLESEKGSRGDKKNHLIGEDKGPRRVKEIKVQEVGRHEEKEILEEKGKEITKDGIHHDEKKVDHEESKLRKENVEKKAPSAPKSSKLPPVCLRVDPLPRRKSANGSSRFSSTPGDKQKMELQSNQAKSDDSNSLDSKIRDKIHTSEAHECKGTNIIEVVDGKAWQKNIVDVKSGVSKPEDNISSECIKTDAINDQSEDSGFVLEKNETIKRKLSEEEAAVTIQSACRGFNIRKWEPIKKLKEIAKVREQIANVDHMFQEMESSCHTHGSGRQRNVISETIMSLLLKLDTIQGLHPSIREVRKSVVEELVSLQEKLDSLMNSRSGDSPQQEANSSCAASNKIEDVISSENGVPDGAFNCGNLELSEANPNGEEAIVKPEKDEDMNFTNEDDEHNKNAEMSSAKDDDHEHLVFEQSSELPAPLNSPENISELDSELVELPQEVDYDHQREVNHKACERLTEEEASNLHENDYNNETYDVLDIDKIGRIDQISKNLTAGIVQVSEVSDAKGSLLAETSNEIETELSMSRKAIDNPQVKEISSENVNVENRLVEMNRELIEENERLRGIMENLIKSGQEQLNSISCLTGRVEDLERKLSKKKKLKVKARKSNKTKALLALDHDY